MSNPLSDTPVRLGAQAFIEQLLAGGVEWIFGNPGTTEQTVIDYLQAYDGIDLVMALHEGVAVGAADGYSRASGKVSVVELHAGPGLGNGLGNIYNAYISHTPMIVYVGQSEHKALYQEPVLSGDFVSMAAPLTKWAYQVQTAEEIPQIVRRALKVATTAPCGPVLLAVPIDLTDAPCASPVIAVAPPFTANRPDPRAIAEARELIAAATSPLILVGDAVASSGAIDSVGRLAATIGAPVVEGAAFETVIHPDDPFRGGRLPGDPTAAARFLEPYDLVVAIGTRVLAQVFPEPGLPLGSHPLVHIGADEWELGKNQPGTLVLADENAAVVDLLDALESTSDEAERACWSTRASEVSARLTAQRQAALDADQAGWNAMPMKAPRVFAEIAAALPENVCVVDESMSGYEAAARYLPKRPGSWFRGAGGIGMGLPRPIGVQVANPTRPVISVVGDGSAMYSLTALWTAAHHNLPVVWIILNNKSYRTLKQNTLKSRQTAAEQHDFVGADLTHPEVDFVAIGQGFGVHSERVSEPHDIGAAIERALSSGAPALIEVVMSGEL